MHTNFQTSIFYLLYLSLLLLLNPTLSNSRNFIPLPHLRPPLHNDSNLTHHYNHLVLSEEEVNSTSTTSNTDTDSFGASTLPAYVSILNQNNFFGTWSSLDSVTCPFSGFFTNSAGLLVIEAQDTDTTQETEYSEYSSRLSRKFNIKQNLLAGLRRFQAIQSWNDFNPWTLLIKMYDGAYVDQNSADVFYQINVNTPISFDPANTTLFIKNSTLSVFLKNGDGDGRMYRQCAADFSLYFADKSNLRPFIVGSKDTSNVGLIMRLESPDCGVSVASGIMTTDGFMDPYQTNFYTFVACAIALIQIIGAYKLKFQVRNRKMAFRVSAGSVWLMATVDYYMLIMNLVLIFAFSVEFVAPLLLYLFLTFYVDRDIIITILKAQKRSDLELSDENCKTCGFHFGLSTVMFVVELIFILMSKLWVIHFTALVFIPQIFHNAKKSKPYVLNFYHVFLMGASRIAFVAYLKLYPENIFRLHPDMTFVLIYGSIMGIQILILLSQTVTPLGCLFFLNKRRRKSRILEEDDVCPICMCELKGESRQTAADSALLDLGETIETPCSHVFHVECLKQWIKNKVECPVCREKVDEILEEVIVSEDEGQRQMPEGEEVAL